jgi:peptidoglycan/LPS O-acetylase OafA/YrhL
VTPKDHTAYRPDIDGLGAIAVGFHAFPEFVQGGFVGVEGAVSPGSLP